MIEESSSDVRIVGLIMRNRMEMKSEYDWT